MAFEPCVGLVWLEFEVAGRYTETDEVFVGELDVIGVLGRQRFGDELSFFGCGKKRNCDEAGAGVVEVLRAEIGDGENFGEDHFFAVGVDFTLDFEGGEAIPLELAEFVERSVGAAFLQCSEFDEAFHLRKPGGMIGVVYPTVLRLEFEGLGAIDLECSESIAAESFFFEVAFGEAVRSQFCNVLDEAGLGFFVGSEEGVGCCAQSVTYGIAGRGCAAFHRGGACGLLRIGAVCIYFCLRRHSDSSFEC